MKVNNIPVFSIPISTTSLGEEYRELNKKLIEDIYDDINRRGLQNRSGKGVHQTRLGLEKIYPSFEELALVVESVGESYLKFAGVGEYDSISPVDFWGNVNNDPTAFHTPHGHNIFASKIVCTGVYFPSSGKIGDYNISDNEVLGENMNVNSDYDPSPGALVLLDPLSSFKSIVCSPKTNRYPFSGRPINIAPKEGTLVLFPSYLSHMVTPTADPNMTRYSIAFNIEIN